MTRRILFVLALTLLAPPCLAQAVRIGPDRYAVAVRRADLRSATPDAARRALARLDRAAMAVCGGSGFSLREVQRAIRGSTCWRDSMADALARIDDPSLSRAWQEGR